ncbi:MAG: radical SAM protein, partial [Solirubrobacterales bacterium]|nr:radical SAM protein [Solirubrobacterales bacterium]
MARLNESRIATTLVTTVVRGLNEDELGDILRVGLDTPYAAGWAIQPVFGSGRGEAIDPLDRVTSTGIIRR